MEWCRSERRVIACTNTIPVEERNHISLSNYSSKCSMPKSLIEPSILAREAGNLEDSIPNRESLRYAECKAKYGRQPVAIEEIMERRKVSGGISRSPRLTFSWLLDALESASQGTEQIQKIARRLSANPANPTSCLSFFRGALP